MNKLVFISVLLLAIIYIQCDDTCKSYAKEKDTEGNDVPETAEFCKKLPTSDKNKYECTYNSKDKKCEETEKATSSADMISIYKISLALFIIFAIL